MDDYDKRLTINELPDCKSNGTNLVRSMFKRLANPLIFAKKMFR